MNHELRLLFYELVELSPSEREQVFRERRIGVELRAEVESLLSFDSTGAEDLTDLVSQAAGEVLRTAAAPGPGHCGPYRLVRLLGYGGMGAVYLAERTDGEIQHRAAIKLLRADGHRQEWYDRFLMERQLLASLRHPSIVHMIDAGHTADDRPYLVMEYVEGVPIDVYAAGIDEKARLKLFLLVCEGVSHAHRSLIIHRDLKPANILVDPTGQPKLLDFGIAKLLEDARDATQTIERLLTPNYASPEQLAGASQTTATDVYSLGAVLYKLLTGATPRENAGGKEKAEFTPPSRMNPNIPMDMDYVVGKALRAEPGHRYVSVDELADDIRAALEGRPVRARSGDVWYRTRRLLRRHWLPVAAATLVIASLSVGLYIANRERAIADRRFVEVRQLANKLFDIDYETRKLAGTTKTRQLIVDTALEYLQRLESDVRGNPELALEVGNAYMRVARVQGVPTSPNLGQMDQAEKNLRIAEGIIQSVTASQPANRTALLRSAQIAHDRMLLARYGGRYDEALALARKSAEWLEKFNAGKGDKSEASPILSTYLNVADQYARRQQLDEALRLCRRAGEFARSSGRQDYLPDFLWITAEVFRRRGDLEQALRDADQSVKALEPFAGATERGRTINLTLALIIRGEILGDVNAISLGQSQGALESLERAFQLADDLVHQDPYDQMVRSRVANAATVMGAILRETNPGRALAVYEHTYRHVSEIKDNSSFRRFEVSVLAGSSYALIRLGRVTEARRRLDAAFERLGQLHLYPADKIQLGSEAADTLRALADYEAGTGNLSRAIEIYEELFAKIQATKPNPESSLTDAVRLSAIYRAEARLQRHALLAERASALAARDRDMWQQWDRKLPDNAFVRRQLMAVTGGL